MDDADTKRSQNYGLEWHINQVKACVAERIGAWGIHVVGSDPVTLDDLSRLDSALSTVIERAMTDAYHHRYYKQGYLFTEPDT